MLIVMKKRISFISGFTMLFFLPYEPIGVLFYLTIWLPGALALLCYSGAFKRSRIS